MRFQRHTVSGVLLAALALFLDAASARAQAPLFISPQRVELFDSRRSEILTVTNRTENNASYELGMEDYTMSAEGATMRVERLEYSARRMIRYSPRRFTLEPGQTQTIRVLGRRSGELQDGTYRTHLVFREVANTGDAGRNGDTAEGGTSFGIGFRFNIAIPVVITVGESDATVMLEEAEVLPAGVAVKLQREGNADAAVRVRVRWEKPDGTTEDMLTDALIRIYREREWVQRTLSITWPNGEPPQQGNLIITLLPEARNTSDVLDELVAPLS